MLSKTAFPLQETLLRASILLYLIAIIVPFTFDQLFRINTFSAIEGLIGRPGIAWSCWFIALMISIFAPLVIIFSSCRLLFSYFITSVPLQSQQKLRISLKVAWIAIIFAFAVIYRIQLGDWLAD